MRVLGIDVGDGLVDRWRAWLAPVVQPFFVAEAEGASDRTLSDELGHTYKTWRLDRSLAVRWLDEPGFLALPRRERSALVRSQVAAGRGAVPSVSRWSDVLDADVLRVQADGRRFVWWPSLLDGRTEDVLRRLVERSPDGAAPAAPPSAHAAVGSATWRAAAGVVPGAEELAGTFPAGSGPNCFSTVLGAAGVAGAADECTLQEPFDAWLARSCRPGGTADRPGTVLAWRVRGRPVHAAVTIGDGWALEKGSGEWWTPRAVRTVRDVVRTARSPGQHLERHTIAAR